MTSPVLSCANVTVQFGGLRAVDDVSFVVMPGELLGLIGPNGAGKTTMMRAITGQVRPQSGSIVLNGVALDGLPIERRIRRGLSLSQQLVKPLREITLAENVALAAGAKAGKTTSPLASLLSISDAAETARAHALLDRVGIRDRAEQRAGTQPLGVLKRLEMARALALDPQVLLLDEPLAGLNSREARGLADTIRDINQAGVTIVLIEHNLGEVMRICQRLVVQDNGRKIADGEPRAVMDDPTVRAAYLGGDTLAGSSEEARHA